MSATATRRHIHVPPTKAFLIGFIRERGAAAVYGKQYPYSDLEAIRNLERMTPREYMQHMSKCDHCDDLGECLGHEAA